MANAKSNGTKQGGNRPPVEHQFKPGQSGNPNGRPRGKSITAALRRLVQENPDGQDLEKALSRVIVKKALEGDHKFVTTILERLDGKVADRLADADGGPLFKMYDGFDPKRV